MTFVFLSYARGDDEPFVKRLYEDLSARGFDIWWDRVSMPCRMLTFYQEIRDAINSRDLLLLVIGPKAVTSDYVMQEWRFAYFVANKRINPILRLDRLDSDGTWIDGFSLIPEDLKLLHCEDFRDDAHYPDHLENLVRQLNELVAPVGKLVAVPELPEGYCAQPERLKTLRDMLLIDLQKPVVVTGAAARVGLQGMGGIGKSVLANALAHHPQIRWAFPDGVYWIRLGQEPRIVDSQRQLAVWLGGDGTFDNVTMGKESLRGVMAQKAMLLILDDVWDRPSADAFNVAGARSRILITTRDAGLVTALAARENHYRVELPTIAEAREIITGAAQITLEGLPPEADEVINECGRLPLALVLCGGMVQGGISWKSVVKALREHDLEFLSEEHIEEEHHRDAWKAMDVSIRVLPEAEQERFAELAVFPVDTGAPLAAVATLWQKTGELSPRQSEALLAKFVRRSLVQHQSSPDGSEGIWFVLHDLMHHFASKMAEIRFGSVAELHEQLIGAYLAICPNGFYSGPNDGYYLQNLCKHLFNARRLEDLASLLTSFNWIGRKVESRIVYNLIEDYDLFTYPTRFDTEKTRWPYLPVDNANSLALIRKTLQLSAHVLSQKPTQLPGQIVGRLLGCEEPIIKMVLNEAIQLQRFPWLRPINPCLTSPKEPLILTLTGHQDMVTSLVVTPDGRRVISGSLDNTLKIWDIEAGKEIHTLTGHKNEVSPLVVTPDGRRVISGSFDTTLKVWDIETGHEIHTLTGHTNTISALAVTPDSRRVISGAYDTLKIWDINTGKEIHTLKGHIYGITSIVITRDGRRVISGSWDKTLKIWDIETGHEIFTLKGHTDKVSELWLTRDGRRVISGSWDRTLKIWDIETGHEIFTLIGQTRGVLALVVTPDGHRVISASFDTTLKVWDIETGKEIHTLNGHTDRVSKLIVSLDSRRLISGSNDNTLKVWDIETGHEINTLYGHFDWITALVMTPDGRRAISGSYDTTLKVWDIETVYESHLLTGHTASIHALIVTPNDGKAISASSDKTLKIWDIETGHEIITLTGHTDSIRAVVMTPDGRRAISASSDKTLKVWDIETGHEIHTLNGHSKWIWILLVTPDGRQLISGSYDTTMKVWDIETGHEIHTLTGHTGTISALVVTPDGRQLISGSYDTTMKIWDIKTGHEIHTLTGHTGAISALVVTPDGRQLISGSYDTTMKVWDIETGHEIHTLTGHTGAISAIIVTPDGRRVISVSLDSTLKVWDIENYSHNLFFFADASINCSGYSHLLHSIIAGDELGRIEILRCEGIPQGTPIITAMKLENGLSHYRCFFCQKWSELPQEELGKEITCPACGKIMQVNPFTYKGTRS